MISKEKVNIFFSTLLAYLIMVGFAVITTVFLPFGAEDTQLVTIPFRAFTLAIALIVLFLNINLKKRNNIYLTLLLVFFALYIFRLFWSITLVGDTVATHFPNHNQYYWLTIGVVFIPMLSMMYCYKKINVTLLFWTVLVSGLVVLLFTMQANTAIMQADAATVRQAGNAAINTISYGHYATMIALFSLYGLLFGNQRKYVNLIFIAGFLFAVFIVLRAGSRSPIVALVVISVIMVFYKGKKKLTGMLFLAFLASLFLIFRNDIIMLINSFAPIAIDRLELMAEGDSSERDILLKYAWNQFLDSPFFGRDFVIAHGIAAGEYPHNIIIESFMALGVLGGGIMLFLLIIASVQSLKLIKQRDIFALFAIIFIQRLILHMFSLAIYMGDIFFCLLALILCTKSKDYIQHDKSENVSKYPVENSERPV